MGMIAAEQLGHRGRVELGVVDAADHRGLVGDAPPGGSGVIAAAATTSATGQRRFNGTSTSRRASRRVERDRQRELRTERGQAPDAGHDPGLETVMCLAPRDRSDGGR